MYSHISRILRSLKKIFKHLIFYIHKAIFSKLDILARQSFFNITVHSLMIWDIKKYISCLTYRAYLRNLLRMRVQGMSCDRLSNQSRKYILVYLDPKNILLDLVADSPIMILTLNMTTYSG